ncbi:MAG TPA: hypothetical protein VK638_14465 [Edaphobacter sp.]|nr:hypothetical protein [Edaphobacter sp.]
MLKRANGHARMPLAILLSEYARKHQPEVACVLDAKDMLRAVGKRNQVWGNGLDNTGSERMHTIAAWSALPNRASAWRREQHRTVNGPDVRLTT